MIYSLNIKPILRYIHGKNCATRYFKRKMERAVLNQMRADGLTPDQLAARFRLKYRARMQFAIARGNSIIARAVGI